MPGRFLLISRTEYLRICGYKSHVRYRVREAGTGFKKVLKEADLAIV